MFLRIGAAAVGAAVLGGAVARRELERRATAAEASHPPIGPLVEVDAGAGPQRVHLVDLPAEPGPARGPAVVLIHGASGNLRDFTFGLAARLRRSRRVIAVDRPGFGHSERGPAVQDPGGADPAAALEPHRPDVQSRAMRLAVATLDPGPVIVLGHSLGAASALAWALDAPASVAGVVSLAGVSHPWPGSAGFLYEAATAPVVGALVSNAAPLVTGERWVKSALRGIFAPQSPPDGYADAVGVGLALRPATFRHNAEDIARLKPLLEAQAARYPGLSVPVEALHGDRDGIVPARVHAIPLSQSAPRARLTLLDGVGHMPHHAAPERVVDAIDRLAEAATA